MPTPTVPAAADKIGSKIDYIAKVLAEQLKPAGFRRRARVLLRESGEGAQRCVQLVDLQGDTWNQGSDGRFTVNLAVCFPALLDLQKDLPGLEWLAQHGNPYSTALGPGGVTTRLSDAMGEARSAAWPEALRAGEDFWADIDARTDLADLARRLAAAVTDLALPWLERRSTLSAFAAAEGSGFGAPAARDRVLAAMLAGEAALAARILRDMPPHRLAGGPNQFDALLALLQRHGVATEGLAWADPEPHPMQQRRVEKVEALKRRHGEKVDAFLADSATLAGREDAFLDAWIEESAANQLAASVQGFRLWDVVAQAAPEARRALLLRLLRRFPEPGPTVESTAAQVWASYENYHHGAWRALAEALLASDAEPCDAAYASALVEALAGTVGWVDEGLMSDAFKAPVAAVLRWLEQRTTPTLRHAMKPALQGLMQAIREATVGRGQQRLAQPPPADLLGEALAGQLASLYSDESRGAFARLYTECPERSYAAADREAVLALARWLRAGPDGRVPLRIEADDWGRELDAALQALPSAQRDALVGLFEWFDASATGKPAKRWLSELDQRRACLPDDRWLAWLGETLPRFARTGLAHFLSAPGFLAFPGETSERVLLGLVHLAGRLDPEALAPALATVARAAFTVVPDQRLRAYAVGAACLAPLAATGPGREALAALRDAVRQKNVKAAIDKALAGT